MLALRRTCSRSHQIRQPTLLDQHETRITFKATVPMLSSPSRQIKVCPYAGRPRTCYEAFWRAVRGLFECATAATGAVLSTTLPFDLTVVP